MLDDSSSLEMQRKRNEESENTKTAAGEESDEEAIATQARNSCPIIDDEMNRLHFGIASIQKSSEQSRQQLIA